VGITAGSREVPGRNACDRRHTYHIIIIKLIFNKCDVGAWTGLIWLGIGTSGGLL